METPTGQSVFLYEGSFLSLHKKLCETKSNIKSKEDLWYKKKFTNNFTTFLDQQTYLNETITNTLVSQWISEQNQDIAIRDTEQVCSWIYPLSEQKFILYFYNLKQEFLNPIIKNLKIKISNENKNKILEKGFCFKLYYPDVVSLDMIFKNLPELTERKKILAENIISNEWISNFPENKWQDSLWKLVEFIQSDKGQASIKNKMKELNSLNFITKKNQIKKL